MATSSRALLVALIGVIACPLLLVIEVVIFVLVGMGTFDEGNPLFGKVATSAAVIMMGAAILALPVTAFMMGARARKAIRSSDTFVAGASKALASQVISGILVAGVVIVQIILILLASRVCRLDGC
jgi:hypothetical protein